MKNQIMTKTNEIKTSDSSTLPNLPEGWYWKIRSEFNSVRGDWRACLYLNSRMQGALDWENVNSEATGSDHPGPEVFAKVGEEILNRYNQERIDEGLEAIAV